MPSPYPPVPSLKKRESPNSGHHQMSFGGGQKKDPLQKCAKVTRSQGGIFFCNW